jgi:hypothetical protein
MHDWTLHTIEYAWAQKRVTVTLEDTNASTRQLVVDEVESLCVPQLQPWGESGSINVVEVNPMDAGLEQVSIQMQTGDVIKIQGTKNHLV